MYHKTDSPKFRVILILPVLSGIMWGSGGVFVRRFDAMGMDNFTMLFTRIIVSVTLLGIGLFLYDRSLLKIRLRDLWVFLGGGILGMFGINLTYNEAIGHGTLALASVLLSMSPLFVVTFSVLFFHEKMTLQKGICMAVALLGCVLVSGVLENISGSPVSPIAVLCGIGSAFFYALYSIFSKAAMERGYHALTITFYCLAGAAGNRKELREGFGFHLKHLRAVLPDILRCPHVSLFEKVRALLFCFSPELAYGLARIWGRAAGPAEGRL